MKNDRGRDSESNQEINTRDTRQQNRRETSDYEFEGMNFEQQRETYKVDRSHGSENDPVERNDSRRRANDS